MATVKSIPEGVQAVFPMLVRGGRNVLIPAQDQFWGDRTARIIDPAGHVWTVASRIEETAEEERAKRWSDIAKDNKKHQS